MTPTPVTPSAPSHVSGIRRSRPGRIAVLVALAALTVSACTYGGTPVAAGAVEVGPVRVSVPELNAEMDYLVANPQVAQSLLRADVSAIAAGGEAAAQQRRQLALGLVNLHVYNGLVAVALGDQGIDVTEQDLADASATVSGVLGAPGAPSTLVDTLEGLVAGQTLLGESLTGEGGEVTDEEVRAAYEQSVADAARFEDYRCSSHILVAFGDTPRSGAEPTPEEDAAALAEIEAAAARLAAGEDFAEVAGEVSDDPGSAGRGGDLGCNFGGAFVPEFEAALADLAVGETSGPVRTEFGYHLIRLDAEGVPAFEDVAEDIRAELESRAADPQEALTTLLTEVAARTDVVVNPRYGTWDPVQLAVVAPSGAAPAPVVVGPGNLPGDDGLGGLLPGN